MTQKNRRKKQNNKQKQKQKQNKKVKQQPQTCKCPCQVFCGVCNGPHDRPILSITALYPREPVV